MLKDIKAAILRALSDWHRDELIRQSHDIGSKLWTYASPVESSSSEASNQSLRQLHFYVDSAGKSISGRHIQKQQIIKKINDLKGSTRMRYVQQQTDYIVVDKEFFGQQNVLGESSGAPEVNHQLTTNWSNSEYVINTELGKFLNEQAQRFYSEAKQDPSQQSSGQEQEAEEDQNQSNGFGAYQLNNGQNSQKLLQSSSKRSRDLLQINQKQYLNKMQRNSTSQGHMNVLNGKQTQQKYQGPNSKKDEKKLLMSNFIQNLIRKEIGSNYQKFIRQNSNEQDNLKNNARGLSRIIDVTDLDNALEFMMSKSESWHQQRQGTLHYDYQKVNFDRRQHFVLSYKDNKSNLNMSRLQKIAIQIPEHEKQVYHEFELIKEKVKNFQPSLIPDNYNSIFDVHRLVTSGPKGMDPCMTFDQQQYGQEKFEAIERIYTKGNGRAKIFQMSESEGVFREAGNIITMPKPQTYHTYCQICMNNYEDFETHIKTEKHNRQAKNQPQIGDIDDIIHQLNNEQRWKVNWEPEPVKNPHKPKPQLQYLIAKDGKKIQPMQQQQNVACRSKNPTNQNTGRKSGRASAAMGKSSRASVNKILPRNSAKSSVARVGISQQPRRQTPARQNAAGQEAQLNQQNSKQKETNSNWNSRKSYILDQIGQNEDEQVTAKEDLGSAVLITTKVDLPNRTEESKTQHVEDNEQETPEIFVQQKLIKCTPFRFPTGAMDDSAEEADDVQDNEDVPMIDVEKLDPSPEKQNEIETQQKEADEEALSEQRSCSMDEEQDGEDAESYEEEMEEDAHEYGETDSWQKDDAGDKTILDRMHQTEAPKKIEELSPIDGQQQDQAMEDQRKSSDEDNLVKEAAEEQLGDGEHSDGEQIRAKEAEIQQLMLEIERLKSEGQNKSANVTPKQTKQKSSAKKVRDPSPSEMSVKSCKSNRSMKSFKSCKSLKSTPVVPATDAELAEAQQVERQDELLLGQHCAQVMDHKINLPEKTNEIQYLSAAKTPSEEKPNNSATKFLPEDFNLEYIESQVTPTLENNIEYKKEHLIAEHSQSINVISIKDSESMVSHAHVKRMPQYPTPYNNQKLGDSVCSSKEMHDQIAPIDYGADKPSDEDKGQHRAQIRLNMAQGEKSTKEQSSFNNPASFLMMASNPTTATCREKKTHELNKSSSQAAFNENPMSNKKPLVFKPLQRAPEEKDPAYELKQRNPMLRQSTEQYHSQYGSQSQRPYISQSISRGIMPNPQPGQLPQVTKPKVPYVDKSASARPYAYQQSQMSSQQNSQFHFSAKNVHPYNSYGLQASNNLRSNRASVSPVGATGEQRINTTQQMQNLFNPKPAKRLGPQGVHGRPLAHRSFITSKASVSFAQKPATNTSKGTDRRPQLPEHHDSVRKIPVNYQASSHGRSGGKRTYDQYSYPLPNTHMHRDNHLNKRLKHE